MSAKQYREYADECMRSATNATLAKECREFLQTAEAWLHAADLLEAEPRREIIVQPHCILTRPSVSSSNKTRLEHSPEKWKPVCRKARASTQDSRAHPDST
jgi:hypothetical protein